MIVIGLWESWIKLIRSRVIAHRDLIILSAYLEITDRRDKELKLIVTTVDFLGYSIF